MPRYIRQRLRQSCGPIVLMNAVKWAGYSLNRVEYLPHFAELCGYQIGSSFGIYCESLHEAILATPEVKLVKRLERPTLRQLDRFLDKGHAAIVRYAHRSGCHYVLVPKRTAKFYYCVNGSQVKTLVRISRKRFSKKLRYVFDGETSRTWIVEGV